MTSTSTPLIDHSLTREAQLARRQAHLGRKKENVRSKVILHQRMRLSWAGLYVVSLIVAAMAPGLGLPLPATLVFLPIFVVLVIRTRRWETYLDRLNRWQQLLERQISRLRGRPLERTHSVPSDGQSTYVAHDLHLFGPNSLWSLIDETLTEGGQTELTRMILAEPPPSDVVRARQNEIKSLRREAWFYQKLILHGPEADSRLSTKSIAHFLANSFVPKWFHLAVFGLVAFWIALIAVVVLASNGILPSSLIVPLLTVFAGLNLTTLFKAGSAFKQGIGLAHHLGELEPLFGLIEKRTRDSERLRALCPTTSVSGPSREVRRLNRVLSFLGVETNPLLHLVLNALTPWSTTTSLFLERRRTRIAESFPVCLQELSQLEALGSLLLLDRDQTNHYPTLVDTWSAAEFKFSGMFHPLIDRQRVVPNDFDFSDGKSLGLLTGSNMSGKSTFLRTIGLNQILANMGAPVFAERFSTFPMRLETCIEVSDSLRDGFSYFYAEVRRLKALLDEAESGQGTFFLIDEIFRGTNNKERQIGSRSVIRTLARAKRALGFVSTHDLELTRLEDEERAVLNLHFREDIEGDEMLFSYRLRRGPSPTTNALKIMERSGIKLDVDQGP